MEKYTSFYPVSWKSLKASFKMEKYKLMKKRISKWWSFLLQKVIMLPRTPLSSSALRRGKEVNHGISYKSDDAFYFLPWRNEIFHSSFMWKGTILFIMSLVLEDKRDSLVFESWEIILSTSYLRGLRFFFNLVLKIFESLKMF